MGLFSTLLGKSKTKADPETEKVYQLIADAIVNTAFNAGLDFRELGMDKAVDVSAEFCFVLLSFVDVNAFSILGSERRDAAFDRIALLTTQAFTHKFFNKDAPAANIAKYQKAMLSVIYDRNGSYGLCRGSFTEISVGFSFYVNKALCFTQRDNIDSIIGDRSKYTEKDFLDLPKFDQIDELVKTLHDTLIEVNAVQKLEQLVGK